VLLPGDRRRAEAIDVLLPGAEDKGSAATGGSLQGGSHCATTGGTPQGTVTKAYAIRAGAVTEESL